MSVQIAVNNPTPIRRRLRNIRVLGISVILLAAVIVAATCIAAPSGLREAVINSIVACLAIGVAGLVVTAPWIVAHTRLRDTAMNSILASPSVTVSSEGASFGWFSPLSVHGLHLSSANRHIEIRAEAITAERSLWQLWVSAPDLGTIKVEKPQVRLQWPLNVDIQGLRNRLEPTFTAIVEDAGLTVCLTGQDESVIEVDDINVTFRVEQTEEGRVLTLDPTVIFDRRELSPKLASKLLYLFDPAMTDNPHVGGVVSLSVDKLRIPIGIPRDWAVRRMELEGKLALHEVSTEVSDPMWQMLVQLVADMNGRDVSDVVRLAQDAEIRFHVRDGRLHHEGLRIGFPDIDPELRLTARGSVGLDKTLDLFVELPRLDKVLRKEKAPARCHITGTIGNPNVAIEDASLVLRQPGRKEPIIAADGIQLNMHVENAASGCVVAVDPVEVFKREKLSLGVAAGLVKLLAPDVESDQEVAGEISLFFTKLRIPIGVSRDQRFKQLEAEGKLTLHHLSSEVKSPLWQGLIRLLAAMNGKLPSNVIRLVEDSEIDFQVRDGRLHHDGQRIGFPEIDPELVIRSRGSIGIDGTLDLHLEIPRLRKRKRDKGPFHCHITGTMREPEIFIRDAPLALRCGLARFMMRAYVRAFRTGLLNCPLRCAARLASIGHSTAQFLHSSWSKVAPLGLQGVASRLAVFGGPIRITIHGPAADTDRVVELP